jgi:hypothetical protein
LKFSAKYLPIPYLSVSVAYKILLRETLFCDGIAEEKHGLALFWTRITTHYPTPASGYKKRYGFAMNLLPQRMQSVAQGIQGLQIPSIL